MSITVHNLKACFLFTANQLIIHQATSILQATKPNLQNTRPVFHPLHLVRERPSAHVPRPRDPRADAAGGELPPGEELRRVGALRRGLRLRRLAGAGAEDRRSTTER